MRRQNAGRTCSSWRRSRISSSRAPKRFARSGRRVVTPSVPQTSCPPDPVAWNYVTSRNEIGKKAMTDQSSPAINADAGKGGFISKVIGPKKRWRAYKARVRQLPENYRTAVDAIERYLMHFVPADGDSAASEFEDLADLFER